MSDGTFMLRRGKKLIALRAGIAGELLNGDRKALFELGVAGPAIFVNNFESAIYLSQKKPKTLCCWKSPSNCAFKD
jgi:hypothetical protein